MGRTEASGTTALSLSFAGRYTDADLVPARAALHPTTRRFGTTAWLAEDDDVHETKTSLRRGGWIWRGRFRPLPLSALADATRGDERMGRAAYYSLDDDTTRTVIIAVGACRRVGIL